MKYTLIGLIMSIWGCFVPSGMTREQFQAQHPNYSAQVVDDIANRIVRPGMTAEQVYYSWGRPSNNSTHVIGGATFEIWYWGNYQSATIKNNVCVDVSQYRQSDVPGIPVVSVVGFHVPD